MLYLCLYCDVWKCRCSCMGSMSVSSCRCCMFVSCVHPVAVVNAELLLFRVTPRNGCAYAHSNKSTF